MTLSKTRGSYLKEVLEDLCKNHSLNRDPTSDDFECGYQQALRDVFERMEK